jgi:gluconokinase
MVEVHHGALNQNPGHGALFVVMGVSGSGKSLIGSRLARALGLEFVEGDSYHSSENVARMSAGIPLTDEDRQAWLAAIAARLDAARRAGVGLVVSCSALKRSYRDVLRAGVSVVSGFSRTVSDVQFVYLEGDRSLIEQRLADRRGHFMPSSLLDSQFAVLEPPSADEDAWVCDIRQPPDAIVAHLVERSLSR